VRIACHELESFFLGDLAAVEQGLGISGLSRQQNNRKYKVPDNLANAPEELKKLTKNKYQKISGSQSIAPFLRIDGSNRSTSFNNLVRGIKKLVEE
jgi:monomeric isocitrate dehydrogenase